MKTTSSIPGRNGDRYDWVALFRHADAVLKDTETWGLLVEGAVNQTTAGTLRIRYPEFELVTRKNYELGGFDYWVRKKVVS